LLGEAFKAEQKELDGEDALKVFQRRQNYADAGVLVRENLPVMPERACDSTPMVANRDNMGYSSGSLCTRSAQRVHTIFIWACVHWGIDGCPRMIGQ